jgi:uncharacterized protein with HEPN domain
MHDHAAEATAMARGRTRVDLDHDRQFALALTKLVEIVGEAAHRVSAQSRSLNAGIAWRQIVGTRNRLVHGYDEVDYDVLWRIVADELPPLIEQLLAILANEEQGQA